MRFPYTTSASIVEWRMSLAERTFEDESGVAWRVWQVAPLRVERREGQRRGRVDRVRGDEERRAGPDRRVRFELRAVLPREFRNGWLAFESDRERRRYAPIPELWQRLGDAALCALCRLARVVGHGDVRTRMA
jgi:hypothetical protein